MGHRAYSRHGNGRFRRATLENTFGLSAPTCPECGRFNPHGVNEPPPENCHACGAPMKPEQAPADEAPQSPEDAADADRIIERVKLFGGPDDDPFGEED